jgi:glutaredoxin 3
MTKVIMYTKDNCPYCDWAKQLLDSKKIQYTQIAVDKDPAKLQEMMTASGRRTVPQIFINDKSIGGFDDLSALATSGELDKLLA